MTRNTERNAQWRIKLEQWKASGLSGAAWCRKNQINYPVFLYWCRRTESLIEKETSSKFVELTSLTDQTSGIDVECHGVLLHLSKDFDGLTFQRCIQLLKGC